MLISRYYASPICFPSSFGYFRKIGNCRTFSVEFSFSMPNERVPERVLVVDDEESIREVVSTLLTSAGYKTRRAGSGMEALALLDSGEEYELMLSDLMMAELDGIGLLERTKERY